MIVVLIILLIFIFLFMAFSVSYSSKTEADKNGRIDQLSTSNTDVETSTILNTWKGLYYKKYSQMSVYAYVNTENVQQDDETYSGYGFDDLTGTSLADVEQNVMYQEGTEEWTKLRISDINNTERLLQINPETLGILDREVNQNVMYPKQFIKPVYAYCGDEDEEFNPEEFHDYSDVDDITKCKIRKTKEETDDEGKEGDQ